MYTAPGIWLRRGGSGSRWGRSTRRRSPKGFARAVAERDAARRPFGPLCDLKFGREPVCQPAFLVTATAAYVKGFRMPAKAGARGCTEAGVRKASREETAGRR